MEFYFYLTIALLVTMPLLRVGCAKNGINKVAATAAIATSTICWIAIVWHWFPASNIYVAAAGVIVIFELGLLLSNKAVARYKALGIAE
ncbi:hypothetical protein [Microbulbifer epialgicus]|uniref:Uncharacterized protein n=1 Tax=Microbulbifer epialgicus TaxID=393907 RepID=A0ABV4NVI3_9GAMM